MTPKEGICCLCGKAYTNYGNNPWPLSDTGRCCEECDDTRVFFERINRLHAGKGGQSPIDRERIEEMSEAIRKGELKVGPKDIFWSKAPGPRFTPADPSSLFDIKLGRGKTREKK
jgi:hypothetical protein